jgi:hypothetical protein
MEPVSAGIVVPGKHTVQQGIFITGQCEGYAILFGIGKRHAMTWHERPPRYLSGASTSRRFCSSSRGEGAIRSCLESPSSVLGKSSLPVWAWKLRPAMTCDDISSGLNLLAEGMWSAGVTSWESIRWDHGGQPRAMENNKHGTRFCIYWMLVTGTRPYPSLRFSLLG